SPAAEPPRPAPRTPAPGAGPRPVPARRPALAPPLAARPLGNQEGRRAAAVLPRSHPSRRQPGLARFGPPRPTLPSPSGQPPMPPHRRTPMTDARHSDAYHDRRAVETTNVPAQDPGLPDDKPDQCPECGTTVFDFD